MLHPLNILTFTGGQVRSNISWIKGKPNCALFLYSFEHRLYFNEVKTDILVEKTPVQLDFYSRFIVIKPNLQGKEKAIYLAPIRNSAHKYLILMRRIKSQLGNRKHNWEACPGNIRHITILKHCGPRIHLIVWKIIFSLELKEMDIDWN